MKRLNKIILIIIIVLALCSTLFLVDFNSYEKKSKKINLENSGLIFSITTFDGKNESTPFVACLGHSWISIDNKTDHSVYLKDYEICEGETLTFSIWAISGHFGIVYNLEEEFIRQSGRYVGRWSLSVNIEESQLETIEEYLNNNDRWDLGMNCSRFSVGLWNELVSDELKLKTHLFIETPNFVKKAMSEFEFVEIDRDFSNAGKVFFYENGVRTELELCQ